MIKIDANEVISFWGPEMAKVILGSGEYVQNACFALSRINTNDFDDLHIVEKKILASTVLSKEEKDWLVHTPVFTVNERLCESMGHTHSHRAAMAHVAMLNDHL